MKINQRCRWTDFSPSRVLFKRPVGARAQIEEEVLPCFRDARYSGARPGRGGGRDLRRTVGLETGERKETGHGIIEGDA